jgi:hypothetical protein
MDTTPAATIECPYCSETINAKSKKCRHCNEIIDPQMREMELLRNQKSTPNVFMNAGGGGGGGGPMVLRRFPHFIHLIISLVTGGLWLPIYILMFIFRNKQHYV